MGTLVESLTQPAAEGLVGPLATLFGENRDAVARALPLALPALAAAFAARTDHGLIAELMPAVTALLDDGDPDARTLAALDDPVTRQGLMDEGAGLVRAALGPQAATVAHEIGRLSGLRVENAGELMKLAGPLALGAIGRTLGGPPTAQGLVDLLQAETPALERALPATLRTALAPLAAEPSPLHGTPVEGAAAAAGSSGRWLPWLIAAVAVIALLAGLQGFGNRGEKATERTPAPAPMVTEVPPETVTLPDGQAISLLPGSIAHELQRFLAGPETAPRAYRFEPFAAQAGAPDSATAAAARQVAAILGAYPAARIRLVGHVSGAEPDTSAARASALAALITAQGIAPERVASEGRGSAEPLATNDTAEGQAQNSRVMLVVTAK
jgi:hypothetical protein